MSWNARVHTIQENLAHIAAVSAEEGLIGAPASPDIMRAAAERVLARLTVDLADMFTVAMEEIPDPRDPNLIQIVLWGAPKPSPKWPFDQKEMGLFPDRL